MTHILFGVRTSEIQIGILITGIFLSYVTDKLVQIVCLDVSGIDL